MSRSNLSFSSLITRAVEEALSHGYQISPDAVKILQKVGERRKSPRPVENEITFETIIREVIEIKARAKSKSLEIERVDLVEAFPEIFDVSETPSVVSQSVAVTSESIEQDVEIVRDPSSHIQPTGIEGFPQLFKSRYEKIVRILSERPEGRSLTKVSKINKEKGNSKIAGLVFSRRPTKNGIEFTIDDDTGSTSILALSPEAKKLQAR